MKDQLNTPILFIIFNRLDTAKKVFNEIKKIRPKYLYVAADGPRINKKGELEKCNETRDIIDNIDWDCKIKTLFRNDNLGCRLAVSSAISWFFENVEYGIILEDDCLPDISFFYFCDELLQKYKDDSRVYHINGTSYLYERNYLEESYYFSRYPVIWGWATWKRAWMHYDLLMKDFPSFKHKKSIKNILNSKKEQKHFIFTFNSMYQKRHNSWSAQWLFAVMKNNGVTITPTSNLIINIGTESNSTHKFLKDSKRTTKELKTLFLPLKHPIFLLEPKADLITYRILWGKSVSKIIRIIRENGVYVVLIYSIKRILKGLIKINVCFV